VPLVHLQYHGGIEAREDDRRAVSLVAEEMVEEIVDDTTGLQERDADEPAYWAHREYRWEKDEYVDIVGLPGDPKATRYKYDTLEHVRRAPRFVVREVGHGDLPDTVYPDTWDLVDEAENEIAGEGEVLEERRDAAFASLTALFLNGEGTKGQFLERVYSFHPGEYTPESWWNRLIYPVLRTLAEDTDRVEKPGDGDAWRWNDRDDPKLV
jgi:hypothetical protein